MKFKKLTALATALVSLCTMVSTVSYAAVGVADVSTNTDYVKTYTLQRKDQNLSNGMELETTATFKDGDVAVLNFEVVNTVTNEYAWLGIKFGNDLLKLYPINPADKNNTSFIAYRQNDYGNWTQGDKISFTQAKDAGMKYKLCVQKESSSFKYDLYVCYSGSDYTLVASQEKTAASTASTTFQYRMDCWETKVTSFEIYSKKPTLTATITGEQPAGQGSQIDIVFNEAVTNAPTTVAVTAGGTTVNCPAVLSADKKKLTITLSADLSYSTTYTVALTGVTSTDALVPSSFTTTFTTNDGAKEQGLAAVNAASSASEMLAALERPVFASLDFFTDTFFSNDTDARKIAFAAKMLTYRQDKGNFTSLEFTDLAAARDVCLYAVKVDSYDTQSGITDDVLGVFTPESFSQADKEAIAGLIKVQKGNNKFCTSAQFEPIKNIAKDIVKFSIASETTAEALLTGNTNLTIINLNDTDFTANKTEAIRVWKSLQSAGNITYYSIDDFKKHFQQASGLAAINNLPARGDLTGLLTKYEIALGLNLNGYENAGPDAVNIKLYGKRFASPRALQTEIDNAVAEVNNENRENQIAIDKKDDKIPTPGTMSPMITINPFGDNTTNNNNTTSMFKDLDSVSWAKEMIEKLAEKGLVSGMDSENYAPQEFVTRAQAASMLVRTFGFDSAAAIDFKDVQEGDWFYDAVAKAYGAGIVSGDDNGYFNPDDSITREQMAVMAYRSLEKVGFVFTSEGASFFDDDQISEYAKEGVSMLSAAGILKGADGYFMPQKGLTRAEAAVIIYQILATTNRL